MNNINLMQWILRIAVAGEFLGHGMFALQGKKAWVEWFTTFGMSTDTGAQLLPLIGLLDIAVTLIVLLRPIRLVLLWAAIWGFWTALVRPLVGEPIWDFVERWTNWGAPLVLLLSLGWPRTWKDWFK